MGTAPRPSVSHLSEIQQARVGSALSVLIATERLWVHRRVEVIRFIDESRVSRWMSIDFTLPKDMTHPLSFEGVSSPGRYLIPLRLLDKRPLKDFDLRDASGTALPTLTRIQNAEFTAAFAVAQVRALLRQARHAPVKRVAPELAEDLTRLASADPKAAFTPREGVAAAEWGEVEAVSAAFAASLVRLLRSRFRLMGDIPTEPGSRTIVKLGFEDQAKERLNTGEPDTDARPSGIRSRFCERFGLSGAAIHLECPVRAQAESFHLEIVAPEGTTIEHAALNRYVKLADVPANSSVPNPPERVLPRMKIAEHETWVDRALFIHTVEDDQWRPPKDTTIVSDQERAELRFRLHTSVLKPVVDVGRLTVGLLAAGLVLHAAGYVRQGGDAGAIILGIPALLAVFVSPGDHPLVRKMFAGVRDISLVLFALSLVAAASLVVDLPSHTRLGVWIVLVVIAVGLEAILETGLRRSRPPADKIRTLRS